mmetsp:Transcript_33324/g.40315  ORF Transcript_33324/g.40315 Transcript_33324/m.40315 type:complete len:277 (-) Transcript_33324:129-959(-)
MSPPFGSLPSFSLSSPNRSNNNNSNIAIYEAVDNANSEKRPNLLSSSKSNFNNTLPVQWQCGTSITLLLCRAVAGHNEAPLGCATLTIAFSVSKGRTFRVSGIAHKEHLPRERFLESLDTFSTLMGYSLEDTSTVGKSNTSNHAMHKGSCVGSLNSPGLRIVSGKKMKLIVQEYASTLPFLETDVKMSTVSSNPSQERITACRFRDKFGTKIGDMSLDEKHRTHSTSKMLQSVKEEENEEDEEEAAPSSNNGGNGLHKDKLGRNQQDKPSKRSRFA